MFIIFSLRIELFCFFTAFSTAGGADTEEDPEQTAEDAGRYHTGSDQTQFHRFESFLTGADERDDETYGDRSQTDVQQGVSCRILVSVQTSVILILRTASAVRRIVDLIAKQINN